MAFSSLRKRYNDLKDPPQRQKGAVTHLSAKGDSGDVVNGQFSPSIDDIDHQHVKEGAPSLSGVDEKGGNNIISTAIPETEGNEFADDDSAVRDIPWTVRKIVSLHDDTTLPTLTFRYFVLAILFVAPGAFLSQMSHFRTTYAPYSVLFVQIASNYAGLWLAKILPALYVRVPFTKYGFNLNPGPWSVKEHVLVTISAASGATYNLAL
jgi:hypothetical protein